MHRHVDTEGDGPAKVRNYTTISVVLRLVLFGIHGSIHLTFLTFSTTYFSSIGHTIIVGITGRLFDKEIDYVLF